jgi:predicted metalloprotease with PDZ domain
LQFQSYFVPTIMIHYQISYTNPLTHLIQVQITVSTNNASEMVFQIPAWRPGRYELQNYASNIKGLEAWGDQTTSLAYTKVDRNRWLISSQKSKEITVSYQYYAHQMDAGGCWLDETQLYLNFICCLLFIPGREYEPCTVDFILPDNYVLAGALSTQQHRILASDYFQLVDSPVIASHTLAHYTFECKKIPMHLWIQGEHQELSIEKLIDEFGRFTDVQIETMGSFPEQEYHYLFQLLPYRHYHGVEHRNSTVITLGAAEVLSEAGYLDLLGISSHELFHAWNIAKIRPAEMMPYDFSRENYFQTGFVAEGFTTYYGDLFLVRSGVISLSQYLSEINTTLHRHFNMQGDTTLSLAESSFDLWVDGYSNKVPNRKVSIYIKGCIVALILDLEIRLRSNFTNSLDDVMKQLWQNFGKKEKGYTLKDVIHIAEKKATASLADVFDECLFGKTDLKNRLQNLLPHFGCTLTTDLPTYIHEKKLGIQVRTTEAHLFVETIAQNSPAEKILSKDDEIIAINQHPVTSLAEWDSLFDISTPITLQLKRAGREIAVSFTVDTPQNYCERHFIEINPAASSIEQKRLSEWLKINHE